MTATATDPVLAAIGANYPGWRVWRKQDGILAAREGGSPPEAVVTGATPADLMRAIQEACAAKEFTPAERAVLEALRSSGAPLSTREVSDKTGLPVGTVGNPLRRLCSRGLATRRMSGRAWLYQARASPP